MCCTNNGWQSKFHSHLLRIASFFFQLNQHKKINCLCLWLFNNSHCAGSQFYFRGFFWGGVHWTWKRHPALITLSSTQREPINAFLRLLFCLLLWCLRSACGSCCRFLLSSQVRGNWFIDLSYGIRCNPEDKMDELELELSWTWNRSSPAGVQRLIANYI